ncbi:hypothetical protein J1N35_035614 [Gossypium stocksii]|uniref:Uncharacterized protein n=1 Tax=Gossypium stocksii TaxID=47602 RepID=A0A9D3ZR43_9ROSI|nr:hypothetical protein J1N35_035614 [Gossypium stocksii]
MAFSNIRAQTIIVRSSSCKTMKYSNGLDLVTQRDVMGLLFGFPIISLNLPNADGVGLPPKEKPKLCNDACENELEKVPMVTTKSGLQYKDIKVGEGPSPPIGFQVCQLFFSCKFAIFSCNLNYLEYDLSLV